MVPYRNFSRVFRVRSPDPFLTIFAIFSLIPMVTEYDGDPIPTEPDYSRLGGTADRPIFWVRSPGPFLTVFVNFSHKSPPNLHSGQGIHLMRVQRAFSTYLQNVSICEKLICRIFQFQFQVTLDPKLVSRPKDLNAMSLDPKFTEQGNVSLDPRKGSVSPIPYLSNDPPSQTGFRQI